jgi:hypothetical protein
MLSVRCVQQLRFGALEGNWTCILYIHNYNIYISRNLIAKFKGSSIDESWVALQRRLSLQ